MPDQIEELGHAVYESTRRAVKEAWPVEETEAGLSGLGAGVVCQKGASLCYGLRIDVRAHEFFPMRRHIESTWNAGALALLRADARRTAEAMTGLDYARREAVPRPCLMLRDGRWSIDTERPAACRDYLSGSVKARKSLWKGGPVDAEIRHPLLAQAGRYAATAVHARFVVRSYDGYSYDLPAAPAEALEGPDSRACWLAVRQAFSTGAESKTALGFSRSEARAGLKTALAAMAATAARAAPVLLLAMGLLTGAAGRLRAETAPAAAPPAVAGKPSAFAATPGDHVRKLTVDGLERSCLIHLPPRLDRTKPAPLVLMLHGAAMNAGMMRGFSGMDQQADAADFITVYPNGTGLTAAFLTWNSGGLGPMRKKPDDVAFIRALLDDLTTILNLDPRRIYAAGMSNGGMMCYRLAAEMPDRIAAIAAVGGTLALTDPKPARPVPLIHFHGTDDRVVPYAGPRKRNPAAMSFRSVPETIATWVELTDCPLPPVIREVPDRFEDGTTVRVTTYGPGAQGAEVVLVDITGGGHTWPGQQPAVSLIGKSTREISANQMIWEFFQKHPLPAPGKSR